MTELAPHLSPREETAASLVAQGLTNKQIAGEMGIGTGRVRVIISAIAYKAHLDASKDERVQVALWWHRVTAIPKDHSA